MSAHAGISRSEFYSALGIFSAGFAAVVIFLVGRMIDGNRELETRIRALEVERGAAL